MSAFPSSPAIPVIVDSPLPSTPLDPTPVQGAAGQQPDSTVSPQDVSVTGTAAAPVQTPTPVTPDPNVWKQSISQQYGISVDSFSNQQDALAAVQMLAEQYANAGFQSLNTPREDSKETVTQPIPAAQVAASEELDLTDLDPKVALAIKKLQAENQTVVKEAQSIRQFYEQQQQQLVQAQQAEVFHRANTVVDKMASPKYGTRPTRNFQQQMAYRNLMQVADGIIAGMQARGTQVPPVERVLELALLLDGGIVSKSVETPKPGNTTAALVQKALNSTTGGGHKSQTGFKDPNDPLGLKSDPQFKAATRAIWNRHQ